MDKGPAEIALNKLVKDPATGERLRLSAIKALQQADALEMQ